MISVMFVCHGNICRSPMAEYIFKHLASRGSFGSRFSCASCATSSEEIFRGVGNPIYPPAAAELARRGIPFEQRRAVQLTKADYDKFDLFVGMDRANVRNMHRIFGGDPEDKIRMLGDFSGLGEVSDPWYSGDFGRAYCDILSGCEALLQALTKEGKDI